MSSIIVLAGGQSDERAVSLRSGQAVADALRQSNYQVEIVDPAKNLEDQLDIFRTADIIFPALHGLGGEDGALQQFLEANHITYVGADSQASALCFDKAKYTDLLKSRGIMVPRTELIDMAAYQNSELGKIPHVLKPNDGGSSIDTFIVRDLGNADNKEIEAAFRRHETLLLQELIAGTEITVAVLGTESLPIVEIIPPPNQEFDYENKYNGATQELCPPPHVSQVLQEQAGALAATIHQLTGCRDMSRTDIIIHGDELYVLETNTIPGLTSQSLLPKAAAAAGYDMATVCSKLVELALLHG